LFLGSIEGGQFLLWKSRMMALNNPTSADKNSSSSSSTSKAMLSNPLALRRRKSKGTIAGFGQSSNEASDRQEEGSASSNTSTQGSVKKNKNQPQHRSSGSSTDVAVSKSNPSHSARVALMCCLNVVQMKARTQLSLCPPGNNRRALQAAMRTRQRRVTSTPRSPAKELIGAATDEVFYRLDKMLGTDSLPEIERKEEDYLMSTNTFDVESDEEASSGDEDDLADLDDILNWDRSTASAAAGISTEEKYSSLREPLFTSPGSDPPNKGQATSGTAGKLPFHRRKIRLFDQVSSKDRAKARTYLTAQLRKGKQRDGKMLIVHLKRMQQREKRILQVERGEIPDTASEDDVMDEDSVVDDSLSSFDGKMTSSISVALLLESLSMNPLESVEGMSKCYDGIVAAGVALLDAAVSHVQPSRSEIMAALAPLLITSLEQASGDVIVNLAKIRRMCGTARYHRRFVQRVAPCLVRPALGAMWCLKHQNDMEPILAAVELILDNADEVFSKGWYDRGQQVLADSARKETLNTAAAQLRNLSSDGDGGLGLSNSLALRRHNRKTGSSTQAKDVRRSEPLAEWEVIAVDRQIRISISNILSKDWSKVPEPKDSDAVSAKSRRSTGTSSHAGMRTSRGGESTKMAGPKSPLRQRPKQYSLSMYSTGPPPAPENMESFSALSIGGRSVSPDMSMSPTSTSSPSRTSSRKITAPNTPKSNYADTATKTPPRSPPGAPTIPPQPLSAMPRLDVLSPSQHHTTESPHGLKSPPNMMDRAPLSPSASVASADVVPHARYISSSSSVNSVGSANSQPAHYRMLTSTAAERKRTVAACRALRSQIQRFEEAFMQMHGRPPKGASERSPLATTYAQYREWKRAIRADAACRIQALFRGARTRWLLLRSSNPRLSRVIMNRAGRPGRTEPKAVGKPQTENVLKRLSIPMEVGTESDRGIGLSPILLSNSIPSSHPSNPHSIDVGVEVFLKPSPQGGSLAVAASPSPTWATLPPRITLRPGGSVDRDNFSSPIAPLQHSPPGGAPTADMIAEMDAMTLPELQARKRDLKQQLKQYDMDFARQYNRMPVKAEKEPIRHLYENYNTLKSEITKIEQDGTAQLRQTQPLRLQQPQIDNVARAQRSTSPPLFRSTSGSGPDSSDSDNAAEAAATMVRPKRKSAPPIAPPAEVAPSTPTGAPSQDMSALKVEKGKLHQMLRSYEKDFFKEHKRQVSSFADIKPVASQYRRYKEIKKAIAALQKGVGER
jgi:hypothetical protein